VEVAEGRPVELSLLVRRPGTKLTVRR
jgi:hypothetical protein